MAAGDSVPAIPRAVAELWPFSVELEEEACGSVPGLFVGSVMGAEKATGLGLEEPGSQLESIDLGLLGFVDRPCGRILG